MSPERRHDAWLKFARDVLDVPLNRSLEDLKKFRDLAAQQHPALIGLVEEYIRLAETSETDAAIKKPLRPKKVVPKQMHLFDLLREKTFFPQNLELARFAERVMPHMRTYRFDKMSRSDIAARIIEYIESNDSVLREALEQSMREALENMSGRAPKAVERKSFLSKWERIIKGDDM